MPFAVNALRKSYAGVEVLKGVDLAVEDGEIHALLGANGAGKSTLIKCLSGAISPDSGFIQVHDNRFDALTPRTARQEGIAVVYQDPSLVSTLSVAANIFLGAEKRNGPFVRRRAQVAEAKRWISQVDPTIDPSVNLETLGAAGVQAVEIARALSTGPKVLILDEPTAALSEKEATSLCNKLLELKRSRLPMLYVTHRLGEVFAIADKITVLRGGKTVLSGRVDSFSKNDIIAAIAGKASEPVRPPVRSGLLRKFFQVDDLLAAGIGPLSFDVAKGEVLGIFGLAGAGRTELLESLFGVRKLHSGTISLDGSSAQASCPVAALRQGVALVPADRIRQSVIGKLSALDNALLPSLAKTTRFGFRHKRGEQAAFYRNTAQFNLQPSRHDLDAKGFSGGNQQKLVLVRWLNDLQDCRLLLLDEPTQGVDVGARHDIYQALLTSAKDGKTLIVTSSEPDELMQIADRVIVLSHGRISGVLAQHELTEERLLALAHGFEDEGERQ